MAEQTQGLTKRDILHIFFKHLKMITNIVLVTMLLTIVVLFLIPREYEVKGNILFKAPRMELSNLYDSENTNQKPYVNIAISEMINAEIPILEAPDLILQVIKEDFTPESVLNSGKTPGKDNFLTPVKNALNFVVKGCFRALRAVTDTVGFTHKMTVEEQALDKMQKSLEIVKARNSNHIEVILKCENPAFGAKFVNALIKRYEQRHTELYDLREDSSFFKNQVTAKQAQLAEIEAKIRDIREKYNMANPKSVYDAKLLAMGNLKQMEASAQARLSALTERKANYQKISNSGKIQFAKSEVLRSNPNLNEIMKSLLQAQEAFDKASSQYTKGSYPYDSAEKQYIQMQARFRDEVESSMKGDELEMFEIQGEISKYEKAIADLDKEIKIVQAKETEYERLLLERDIISNSYKGYTDKGERAATSSFLNDRQISNVIQVGTVLPPLEPSSPLVGVTLIVAFILSLFASFGLILLFEYMNHTYRVDEDVEAHLGIRVMTSFPEL